MIGQPQFEIVEPRSGESPVLVEVPHAGLFLDAESLAWSLAPARSIAADADLHVDDIFHESPSEGATLIHACSSRYVVDLNRGLADCDGEAVEGGGRTPWPRGLVWRLTTDGAPALVSRLPRYELERRLELVYRPYHAAVERLLTRKRSRFGYAVLLCAHSMPSHGRGRTQGGGDGHARADVVPGTRGRTTAAGPLIDIVDRTATETGFSVRHDEPYRGGFSTGHYGKPDHNIHAIQVEIARRLYMDESSLRLSHAGFETVREFARTLVSRLADGGARHAAVSGEANAGRT